MQQKIITVGLRARAQEQFEQELANVSALLLERTRIPFSCQYFPAAGFNIVHWRDANLAISNIIQALDNLTPETINKIWRQNVPHMSELPIAIKFYQYDWRQAGNLSPLAYPAYPDRHYEYKITPQHPQIAYIAYNVPLLTINAQGQLLSPLTPQRFMELLYSS